MRHWWIAVQWSLKSIFIYRSSSLQCFQCISIWEKSNLLFASATSAFGKEACLSFPRWKAGRFYGNIIFSLFICTPQIFAEYCSTMKYPSRLFSKFSRVQRFDTKNIALTEQACSNQNQLASFSCPLTNIKSSHIYINWNKWQFENIYLCGNAGAPTLVGNHGVSAGLNRYLASGIVNSFGLSTAQYIPLTNTEAYGAICKLDFKK